MTKESICNSGHHCLSAIEVVRTATLREYEQRYSRHHCLSAIEVVRTLLQKAMHRNFIVSPLPVGN